MILPPSFTIRKTGNLYQLRHKDFGTVFQSHNRKELENYIWNRPSPSSHQNCRTTAVIMNVCALASSEN